MLWWKKTEFNESIIKGFKLEWKGKETLFIKIHLHPEAQRKVFETGRAAYVQDIETWRGLKINVARKSVFPSASKYINLPYHQYKIRQKIF